MAHASDWYSTLVEGVAGVPIDPATTGGPRPVDGFNLWPAILAGGPSPRTEIIHQVNSSFFTEGVQALRVGDLKLIRGPPGDGRTIAWPERSQKPVPLGKSGAVVEPGTDHVRGTTLKNGNGPACKPFCLFNVSADPGEANDLSGDGKYAAAAGEFFFTTQTLRQNTTTLTPTPNPLPKTAAMIAKLDAAGASGPPRNWIWQDPADFHKAAAALCPRELQTGSVQPQDW